MPTEVGLGAKVYVVAMLCNKSLWFFAANRDQLVPASANWCQQWHKIQQMVLANLSWRSK